MNVRLLWSTPIVRSSISINGLLSKPNDNHNNDTSTVIGEWPRFHRVQPTKREIIEDDAENLTIAFVAVDTFVFVSICVKCITAIAFARVHIPLAHAKAEFIFTRFSTTSGYDSIVLVRVKTSVWKLKIIIHQAKVFIVYLTLLPNCWSDETKICQPKAKHVKNFEHKKKGRDLMRKSNRNEKKENSGLSWQQRIEAEAHYVTIMTTTTQCKWITASDSCESLKIIIHKNEKLKLKNELNWKCRQLKILTDTKVNK